MEAGRLDQRITIQRKVDSVNDLGENEPTWANVVTVWAEKKYLRGREFFAASQAQSDVSCVFRIRHRAGLTGQMRVVHGSERFDISAVLPSPRKDHIELMAVEGVRDGR